MADVVDGEFDDQRRLADAAVISSRPRDSSTLMNSEPTEQHGLSHDTKMSDQSMRGLTVWLTGLPGSGKTTSALALHTHLERTGRFVALLDGDELRHGISSDLGFSDQDRDESVRRAGEIALLLAQQGAIVIVSLVSPRRAARDKVRRLHEQVNQGFFEVHVSASLEVCERRDPKALYRKSRGGHLANMTGVDDPYESPILPELVLATDELSLTESIDLLTGAVLARLRDL